MIFSLRLGFLAFAAVACGGKVPAQSASARGIVLSEQAAPSGYVRLQQLSVKSGKGCGVLGEAGSREGAEALLRNQAEQLGASYVQLTSVDHRAQSSMLEHVTATASPTEPRAAGPAPPACRCR